MVELIVPVVQLPPLDPEKFVHVPPGAGDHVPSAGPLFIDHMRVLDPAVCLELGFAVRVHVGPPAVAATFIAMDKVFDALLERLSVTVGVKVKVPAVVGVPQMHGVESVHVKEPHVPVLFNVRPVGRPEGIFHE